MSMLQSALIGSPASLAVRQHADGRRTPSPAGDQATAPVSWATRRDTPVDHTCPARVHKWERIPSYVQTRVQQERNTNIELAAVTPFVST